MHKELSNILKAYILSSKLQENDFLFGTAKNTPYDSFSRTVSSTFKKYTGKALSANLLRHSFVSNFLNRKNLSHKMKLDVATMMAHSITMQSKYNRIDINDDDDE